jgi:hypothetical protein
MLLLAALAACDRGPQLPQGADALEAASLRGDSIARQLASQAALADTLARVASGELDPTALESLASRALTDPLPLPSRSGESPAPLPSGGEDMTQRALARGDSLARAAAQVIADRKAASSRGLDSLRGRVVTEGEPPMRRVMLSVPSIIRPVALSGMPAGDLIRLGGLEVVVRGVRISPRDMAVTSFVVRASDGTPVLDGILRNANGRWSLDLTDGGSRPLSRVPVSLQQHVGARVWIGDGESATLEYVLISGSY